MRKLRHYEDWLNFTLKGLGKFVMKYWSIKPTLNDEVRTTICSISLFELLSRQWYTGIRHLQVTWLKHNALFNTANFDLLLAILVINCYSGRYENVRSFDFLDTRFGNFLDFGIPTAFEFWIRYFYSHFVALYSYFSWQNVFQQQLRKKLSSSIVGFFSVTLQDVIRRTPSNIFKERWGIQICSYQN